MGGVVPTAIGLARETYCRAAEKAVDAGAGDGVGDGAGEAEYEVVPIALPAHTHAAATMIQAKRRMGTHLGVCGGSANMPCCPALAQC